MKKLLIVLIGCMAALSAHASDARSTVIDKEIGALARLLQARLPSLAVDGLCEAEREAHGWKFTARVRTDDKGADEVQVIVQEAPGSRSALRVQGVRVDSNLLTSKQSINAALTAEWTDKILKLVEKAD